MRIFGRGLALLGVCALLIYACTSDTAGPGDGDGDGNGNGETRSMAIHAGNQQQATAGAAVAVAPAVRITDQNGQGVGGVEVKFAVASGGGSVSGDTQTTNADGVATVGSWTLGTTAGQNSLTATAQGTVSGSPATFTATGLAGEASAVVKAGGDNQVAVAGQAVGTAPAVRVTDEFGNGIAGVQVTFEITSGGGSATGTTQTTSANGSATVGGWTLGPDPGENTMTATADGDGLDGNPAVFTATGTVGPPAQLTIVTGDQQQAAPGAALPVSPTVRLTDADDRPVAGATITFAVASGGGSVTGEVQTTDDDGTAAVGSWTLGPDPGENTLTATAEGDGINGNPVTFTAQAVTAPPAQAEAFAGQDEVQIAGRAVSNPPAVRVTDAGGGPVPGVPVTFAVTAGGGSIELGSGGGLLDGAGDAASAEDGVVMTDEDGVAALESWTLGPDVGENSVEAVVEGLPDPVTFTAVGAFDPEAFAGTWIGTWNNVTFASQGSVQLTITVDPDTREIDVILDMGGGVFGQGDPPAKNASGGYSRAGVAFDASLLLGNGQIQVSPTGEVSGSSNVLGPNVTRVDVEGSITPTEMQFESTIILTGGGEATAITTLTRIQ